MSTSPETSAAVKIAVSTLTEDAVQDWLRCHASRHRTGLHGLRITISSENGSNFVLASAKKRGAKWAWDCEVGSGSTIEQAVANLRLCFQTPAEAAQELREHAARLLAEAAAIEAGAKEEAA